MPLGPIEGLHSVAEPRRPCRGFVATLRAVSVYRSSQGYASTHLPTRSSHAAKVQA